MRVVSHPGRKDGKAYSCRDRHCASRSVPKLDAYVTGRVLERLSRADVAEGLADMANPVAEAARQRADALRAELAEAFELWRAGKLSVGAYGRMESDLQPRIAEADREARKALVPIALDVPTEGVDAWWDGLDHEQHREVVAALVAVVAVHPLKAGMSPRRFYPELVDIEWR